MLEETSALLSQVHTIFEKREQELEQVCLARGGQARTRNVLSALCALQRVTSKLLG